MKNFIAPTIILVLISLFIGYKISKKNEIKKIKIFNEKAIVDLTRRYSSISNWDSLETYSYVFQKMFIEEKTPISFKGELKDITKSDSIYYLKVYNIGEIYYRNYIAIISTNPIKFAEIRHKLESNNYSDKGCFIISVSKISSALPKIISDIEDDGDYSYSHLAYDDEETLFILKGDLIDFYLNQKTGEDYE